MTRSTTPRSMTRSMKRRARWLAALLLIALPPLEAEAVELSVIGPDYFDPGLGTPFTLRIALSNDAGVPVAGLRATISGADSFSVLSGRSATHHLTPYCTPDICLGGIDTVDNQFFNPANLSQGTNANPRQGDIVIIDALGLRPSVSDGSLDPGLIGGTDEPSALDVSIQLAALSPGVFYLTVGGTYSDGFNTLPITQTAMVTVVIPEPSTAILLGLGLAGLGMARRRAGALSGG